MAEDEKDAAKKLADEILSHMNEMTYRSLTEGTFETRADKPRRSILEELEQIEKALGPIIQAFVIYDCKATEEQVVLLRYGVTLAAVIRMFKEESGPILGWLDPYGDRALIDLHLKEGPPRGPINKHGEALVISEKHWKELQKLTSEPIATSAFGPRLYNLNELKEQSRA